MRLSSVILIVSCLALTSCGQRESDLKIHFIRVPGENAILIQAPNNETALIDAGDIKETGKLIGYLKKEKLKKLDYLILTHPHLGHFGGAFTVVKVFEVKNIYDNGLDIGDISSDGADAGIGDAYRQLIRNHPFYKKIARGDSWKMGEVMVRVLWPSGDTPISYINDTSLVLMVEYGKFRCLLTSDITANVEKSLLEQERDLRAELLQVSHHGSIDASSEEFLKAVEPEICVITADKGSPSSRIVNRLKALKSKLYITYQDNDIVIGAIPEGKCRRLWN